MKELKLCDDCKHLFQGDCMHPSNISVGDRKPMHFVETLRIPGLIEGWLQGYGYMCGKRGKNWKAKR